MSEVRTFPRGEIFDGDIELIDYVQRDLGMALTGDVREQYLRVAFGTGANGKSTLFMLVRRILGDYAVQLPPDLLLSTEHTQHPTGFIYLRGAVPRGVCTRHRFPLRLPRRRTYLPRYS